LRKEPRHRYATSKELADDLDRFLSGQPIVARPVGGAERAYKWIRRHPAPFALIVVVLLGLAASGIGFWPYGALLRSDNARLQIALRTAQREAEQAEAARHAAQDIAEAEADQRRRAERVLYFSRIGLAEREWGNSNVAGAEMLLDQCLPRPGQADLRGWEWHY